MSTSLINILCVKDGGSAVDIKAFTFILDIPADLGVYNGIGMTALMYACKNGYAAAGLILIASGASNLEHVAYVNGMSFTALDFALAANNDILTTAIVQANPAMATSDVYIKAQIGGMSDTIRTIRAIYANRVDAVSAEDADADATQDGNMPSLEQC
jgi:ankyrin repeat protein